MNIAIDTRITHYTRAGISRYARGLVTALAELPSTHSYYLLQSWRDRGPLVESPRFHRRAVFCPPHSRLEPMLLPIEISRLSPDLVHGIDFFCATPADTPQVLTVHDLYFLHDPTVMDRASYLHYRRLLTYLAGAAHIICDSEHTRHDLLEIDPGCEGRTSVVYPGIDSGLVSGETAPTPLPGTQQYLLFVGTVEPRKNLIRMLEAYRLASDRRRGDIPSFVIAGALGHRANEVRETIARLGLAGRVRLTGHVADEQLVGLYRNALALLAVSTYEGFGFTLLEAMALGVPVITANVSSTREVAGPAALLADPQEVDDIANAIERVLSDSALRRELIREGLARTPLFSWARAAEQVVEIYNRCGSNR